LFIFNKITQLLILIAVFLLLFSLHAYGAFITAVLYFAFYAIVLNNKKFEWLKEKFEAIL